MMVTKNQTGCGAMNNYIRYIRYYLSLPFIWIARASYDIHVSLDRYTSWILDEEENLFSYEEVGERIDHVRDRIVIDKMEKQLKEKEYE